MASDQVVEQTLEKIKVMHEEGLLRIKGEIFKGHLVISFISPLMQRVHKSIKHSGEMTFMDATGTLDKLNHRVFLLLTHSVAGGLPLGCLITSSESKEVIEKALALYCELLDNDSFYGRGSKGTVPMPYTQYLYVMKCDFLLIGPVVFLTDDSAAERSALEAVFPDSIRLLCVFHVLQAYWRFLWDSKNTIPKEDRPHLFALMKDMVYAETVEELEDRWEACTRDATLRKHSSRSAQLHVSNVYEKRERWALCFRQGLPVRGNATNNYAEAAMRIIKDKIFHRMKAFNLSQLLDFLITRMEQYYEARLIDIANGRLDRVLTSRFRPKTSGIDPESIVRKTDHEFEVPSEDTTCDTVSYCDTLTLNCNVYRCLLLTGVCCQHVNWHMQLLYRKNRGSMQAPICCCETLQPQVVEFHSCRRR